MRGENIPSKEFLLEGFVFHGPSKKENKDLTS